MTAEPIRKAISNIQLNTQPAIKRLKISYVLAIAMLIALTFSSHLILKRQITENESSGKIINAGASLRTSSQRIALLARNLIATNGLTERENVRKEILYEVERMDRTLSGLMSGDPSLGLPRRHSIVVEKIFNDPPMQLNHRITKFLEEARELAYVRDAQLSANNEHMRYVRKEASGQKFLLDLDGLVRQYQEESDDRLLQLQEIERVIVLSEICILLLMALFIFKPLIERVDRDIEELNTVNDSLEQKVVERTAMAEQRELKLQQSELLARLDPLTEVLNRRGLGEMLSQESRALTHAVVLLDLDDFKYINDRYGHAVGDHALKEVARVLRSSLRSSDIICRVGGDEFLVLLPDTPPSAAVTLAEKIRAGIESAEIFTSSFERVLISASLGMAALDGNGATVDELLQVTHSALYHSKRAGKNRVSIEPAGQSRS